MAKNQARIVYSPQQKAIRAVLWVLLAFFAVLVIFPVVYIILGSFKDNAELLRGGSNIFPSAWVVQNYVDAWNQANFAVYTKNSILLNVFHKDYLSYPYHHNHIFCHDLRTGGGT